MKLDDFAMEIEYSSAEKIWARDWLERRAMADQLTQFVANVEEPLSIALDGGWGCGKTFFLKRWKADLIRQGFSAIYFNAWEDDSSNNALLSLVGQLHVLVKGKGVWENFLDTWDFAFKASKKISVNFVNAFFLKNTIPTSTRDFKSAVAGVLDDYSAKLASRRQFQTTLIQFAQEVKKETGRPLVFIIDELERCRPAFVVDVLECIKHLFEIPNIVFILGVDKSNLTKSIQSAYGAINTQEYLRRFFDRELLMKSPLRAFCDVQIRKLCLEDICSVRTGGVMAYQKWFSTMQECLRPLTLTLRQLEFCFRMFHGVVRDSENDLKRSGELQPFNLFNLFALCVIKMLRTEDYRLFFEGGFPHDQTLLGLLELYFPQVTREEYTAFKSDYITAIERLIPAQWWIAKMEMTGVNS